MHCSCVFFRDAGGVAGQGRVDPDADIWLDRKGGRACAAQPDLFLRREYDMDFGATSFVGQFADCFDAQPAGHAVIERLRYKFVAHFQERFFHDHKIANFNVIVRFFSHAEINKEITHGRDFLAVFWR